MYITLLVYDIVVHISNMIFALRDNMSSKTSSSAYL